MRINLYQWRFFRKKAPLEKINRIFAISSNIMPHQLSASVGCTLDVSMEILMYLFYFNHANLFLLIYHSEHPSEPILDRSIFDGYPDLPLVCPVCEEPIENEDELLYDFTFVPSYKLEFFAENENALHQK